MDFAGAITAVRTATRYDLVAPSPVTDAQVIVWLNSEMARFRRALNAAIPQLYRVTSGSLVIASGAQAITKPGDLDSLIRLERSFSGGWVNIEPSDQVNPEFGAIGFEDVGATYLIWPTTQAPGTYRLVYSAMSTDGALAVPAGLEDVVVERVCARVKERLAPEEAQLHFAIADRIWQDQIPALKRQYGNNNAAGFTRSYRGSFGGGRGTR